MTSSSDIIDLTNSFTLANHCGLSNIVIDLDTDDSFCIDVSAPNDSGPILSESATGPILRSSLRKSAIEISKKKKVKRKGSLCQRKDEHSPLVLDTGRKNKFGGCPICWDELGKNPLASTKCGHVYCIKCIQEYLKIEKKCPTCRESLKGNAAYHPLYLS